MGVVAADVYANLNLIWLVALGLAASNLQLKAGQANEPEKSQINIVVTLDSIHLDDDGPIRIEDLKKRLVASGDRPAIRIQVDPAVSIEREHAVLAAVTAAGAASIGLTIFKENTNEKN